MEYRGHSLCTIAIWKKDFQKLHIPNIVFTLFKEIYLFASLAETRWNQYQSGAPICDVIRIQSHSQHNFVRDEESENYRQWFGSTANRRSIDEEETTLRK